MYNFLQPTSNEELAAQQELSVEYLPGGSGPEQSIFDLTLMLTDDGEGLHGVLHYDTGQFEPPTIARMADDLRTLLEAAVGQSGSASFAGPQLTDGRPSEKRGATGILPVLASRSTGGTPVPPNSMPVPPGQDRDTWPRGSRRWRSKLAAM